MFANAFQSGFISIFYSVGSAPLSIWNKEVKNGHIRRVVDEEVKSLVLEIAGTNVATTYITCPQKPRVSLAIKLPFLVMIIKNMKKYFTFEIQILDDKDIRRRFRVSNFQSTTKVRPFCTTMPIGLSDGWNQVQFNLADFTKRAYGSTYLETVRVQVHANVRIRRIYFSDTLYSEDEMPNEFRLFLPTAATKSKTKDKVTAVYFIGTCLRYDLLGKVEKKAPVKTSAAEEVPSGAPPSPVETTAPPDEGPLPTAEVQEEPPEGSKAEEASVQEEAGKEEEAPPDAAPTEASEVYPEDEPPKVEEGPPAEVEATPVEGEAPAEDVSVPPAEGEAPATESEAAPTEEAQPEQVSEAPPEGTEQPTEEPPPEDKPTEETPAEEAPKEE